MAPHTRVQSWAPITLGEADSFATALDLMKRGGYQLTLARRAEGGRAGMVTVMEASPLVVSPELGEAEAHQLTLLKHLFRLPVVDASGQLVRLHVAEQLHSPKQQSKTKC
jgi:CBS domain-containing protein